MGQSKPWRVVGFGLLAIALIGLPQVVSSSFAVDILIRILLFAFIGVAWNLQSWLGNSTGGIQLTVYSVILMAVILWRSPGIMGFLSEVRQRQSRAKVPVQLEETHG